jgi:asparagine synthase (glutamine-hydrolysing)
MGNAYLATICPTGLAAPDMQPIVLSPPALRPTSSSGRITTYCGGQTETISLPDQAGVIIGRLFTREDRPKRVKAFTDVEAAAIRRNGLPHLLSHYWGGYIAIMESIEGEIQVLRDPSGALPSLYVETDNGIVIGSDAAILHDAGFFLPEIDWHALGRYFVAYDLATQATALKGVQELLPGNVLSWTSDDLRQTPLWSPWLFTGKDKPQVSPEDLRQIVRSTLHAWASTNSSILLGVSGGLDSSILAAALRDSGTDLTCYTMVTDQAEGDERHYARQLTRYLGLELREHHYKLADIDLTRSTASHLARPMGHAFGQSRRVAERGMTDERNCNAQYNGIGGDNVFCSLQSTTPILDRVLYEGIGPGVFSTFADICQLTESTAVDALSMVLKRAARFDRYYRWKPTIAFINRDIVEDWKFGLHHPWMEAPSRSLPGTSVHISLIIRALSTLDSLPSQYPATQLSPLLSQPIVELCLSVPTWQWFEGGMNRSLARRAFLADLPPEILQRRSKGGPNGFVYDVISNNRPLLRELLLDGVLVEARLLDRSQLELALRSDFPANGQVHVLLSSLAEAETWTRHWQSIGTTPPRGSVGLSVGRLGFPSPR